MNLKKSVKKVDAINHITRTLKGPLLLRSIQPPIFPRRIRIILSPQGKKIPAQGGANEREEALKHSASLYKTRCKGAILQADIPAQGGGGCVEQPSLLSSSYEFFLLRPIHPKPTRPMPRSMRVEGSGTPTTGGSPPLPPFSPIRSAGPVKFATSRPAGLTGC